MSISHEKPMQGLETFYCVIIRGLVDNWTKFIERLDECLPNTCLATM